MFPRNENQERVYVRMFPWNENRHKGTFAKTTLLRNRPFVSWQRRKKRTLPPPKENNLENFSGLKEILSRLVVDAKTL